MCSVDKESGKTIHDILVFENEEVRFCHPTNSYASCTPAIEDGMAYVHFGSYGTAVTDIEDVRKNGNVVIWIVITGVAQLPHQSLMVIDLSFRTTDLMCSTSLLLIKSRARRFGRRTVASTMEPIMVTERRPIARPPLSSTRVVARQSCQVPWRQFLITHQTEMFCGEYVRWNECRLSPVIP